MNFNKSIYYKMILNMINSNRIINIKIVMKYLEFLKKVNLFILFILKIISLFYHLKK
jgi:hypothetical protein